MPRMFARGRRQVDVVVALGVSAQTALRWHRAWVFPPTGRTCGLDITGPSSDLLMTGGSAGALTVRRGQRLDP
jgi:hypothetical protein